MSKNSEINNNIRPWLIVACLMAALSYWVLPGNGQIPPSFNPLRFIPREVLTEETADGSGKGKPGDTEPRGGTRPSNLEGSLCPEEVAKPLKALVPSRIVMEQTESGDRRVEYVEEYTVSDSPTFWFSVPYHAPLQAEFALVNENAEELYSTTITLPENPGIIGIGIPAVATDKLLELGKYYRWQLTIVCYPDRPSLNNLFVQGWVQQVTPSQQISQWQGINRQEMPYETLRQAVAGYATEGIWYDALTLLGDRRLQNPSNSEIAGDWQSLLNSVNLDDFADEAIVERYVIER
ncbi:DUF928 domain-containing protein [Laspinema olomoucense]|uniref:DUF928 domain-containing protein n=1 Tax=Laspinema olomoucense TaxID=3231600 RepID=UPI0021BAC73A|nr:DUF928 domain-containing protein [Laspinema sp. D3d]MCT7973687.1 DUF928 domain-containing protein [Laspinema sp. D3d]